MAEKSYPVLNRFVGILAGAVGLLVLAGVGIYFYYSHPLPAGKTGADAEALTGRIEAAVRLERFKELQGVSFTFRASRSHFRDLKRHLAEVTYDDLRILMDLNTGRFKAYRHGTLLEGPAAQDAFKLAYQYHTNDFFWLNPFYALRSPGAERYFVNERQLLVTFTSGGVTPGDSYLIETDNAGLPMSVRMWVSTLPLKGLAFSFEDWQELEGTYFARKHRSPFGEVIVSDIKTYPGPPAEDRFKELFL
ncbi:MAG: hypothetical protein HS115_15065 [Spirochaetales bacterium]|nr:hypothetical protein [Spirochaetales bacterium]